MTLYLSHSLRKQRKQDAIAVQEAKLQAAFNRIAVLEEQLAWLGDLRVRARMLAILPCIVAQQQAADSGTPLHSSAPLVHSDTQLMAGAAKHNFQCTDFRHLRPQGARAMRRGSARTSKWTGAEQDHIASIRMQMNGQATVEAKPCDEVTVFPFNALPLAIKKLAPPPPPLEDLLVLLGASFTSCKAILPPPAPPQLPICIQVAQLEAFRQDLYTPCVIQLTAAIPEDRTPSADTRTGKHTFQCLQCELLVATDNQCSDRSTMRCPQCHSAHTLRQKLDYHEDEFYITLDEADLEQSCKMKKDDSHPQPGINESDTKDEGLHAVGPSQLNPLKRKRELEKAKDRKAKIIFPRRRQQCADPKFDKETPSMQGPTEGKFHAEQALNESKPCDNIGKEQGNENKEIDNEHTGDDYWSGHVYQPELGLWLVNEEPKPKVRPDTPWPTPPHSARSCGSVNTNHGATVDAEMLRLIEEPTITECIRGLHRQQKLEKRQKRNKKGIASIVRRIKSEDEEVIARGLADLEKALEEGRRQQLHKGAVQNETVVLFGICGGLERLEDLQTLNEESIWSPAMDLLETYFELVDDNPPTTHSSALPLGHSS